MSERVSGKQHCSRTHNEWIGFKEQAVKRSRRISNLPILQRMKEERCALDDT